MRIRFQDTIATRFALTILLAIVVAVALAATVIQFGGVWVRAPARELGLLQRADDIVRMIEAVPAQERQTVADAAENPQFYVDWYPAASTPAKMLDAAADTRTIGELPGFLSGGRQRRIVFVHPQTGAPSLEGLRLHVDHYASAYLFSVQLRDAGWVVFTAPFRFWGLGEPARIGIGLTLLVVSIVTVSALATYHLSRPISAFTQALRRFGTDPRASPIPEAGPRELRASIAAFNAMQGQIQKFVDDRTAMLAAISHDLRTPLTKMRLRGEFVEDEGQRARLFRDVDDMRAMVDSALAFFRDDFQAEETTAFDFPQLLRTIADDYSDQGHEVSYDGAEHLAFRGRPFALKRAFTNIVDNAVKYGRSPAMQLRCSEQLIEVAVTDSGPGIPPEAAERVFSPFYRLERSRNRATGGVGLGLTAARAVIRGHGGDISLSNRVSGGLEVRVVLPTVSA